MRLALLLALVALVAVVWTRRIRYRPARYYRWRTASVPTSWARRFVAPRSWPVTA